MWQKRTRLTVARRQHLRRAGAYVPAKKPPLLLRLWRAVNVPFYPLEKWIIEPISGWTQRADLFILVEKVGLLIAIFVFLLDYGERQQQTQLEAVQVYQVLTESEGDQTGVPKVAIEAVHEAGLSLAGISLKNTNLARANLQGAQLQKSNLQKSNLVFVNLSRANLSEADFSEANLSKANFRNANLFQANFRNADLFQVNFRNAYLGRADLRNTYLDGADFKRSILRATDFRNSKNLTPEQFAGKEPPLLCNTALPKRITDAGINPDRDCDRIPGVLIRRYGSSIEKAQEYVDHARQKKWE